MGVYEYLEDGVTADVTLVATGHTLAEVFFSAAEATTNVMVADLATITPVEHRQISLEGEALDLLLRRFLDEIVFLKDTEGLLLRPVQVKVDLFDGRRLFADMAGEKIDPARHELLADVKAVTLHGLAVEQTADGWRARVTLDV